VTDPAGKWKQFTKDVLGNLTTVVEPDPANQPGGTVTTSYTYNWMKQVTQVSMPRGSTTQTRTFVYDTRGRLTSGTSPENGTVTYTYNSTNTLNTRVDAKGQATVYTYDSLNRVLEIQRYPQGVNYGEDVCARVTYTYDTNPVNSSFSQYSLGRLTTAQYYVQGANYNGQGCSGYGLYDTYTEMYSYHPAGAVTAKNVGMSRVVYTNGFTAETTNTASVEADYTYDSAGRTSTVTYPMTFMNQAGSQPVLTMAYDTMGRPSSLTDLWGDIVTSGQWVSGVQYDYAGRLSGMNYYTGQGSGGVSNVSETRTYNVNGQLASIGWPNQWGEQNQYEYSATQNNGQITQAIESVDYYGEYASTVSYQYDALKRLTSAASAGNATTPYTQTFQYDGFGNLTAKVLNGTTTPIAVNAATNQLTNAYYDANGNMTSGAGATFTYDEANRMSTVSETSGGEDYYGYDAANKRIYMRDSTTTAESFTFYGAKGEKLGKYGISQSNNGYRLALTPATTSIWFAGRLIMDLGGSAVQDRLGSNGFGAYLPYGETVSASTGNDHVMFATYTRDSYSGLDYADQRFYASTYGRFNTPDPTRGRARGVSDPNLPGSWNKYAYVLGDPVNHDDPTGRELPICDDYEIGCCDPEFGCVCDPDDPSCGSPCGTGYCPEPGLPGGGGGGNPGNNFASVASDEKDAGVDLGKTNCYKLLGFASASAAQSWYNTTISPQFHLDSYGMLSVQNGTPATDPAAAMTLGFGVIDINTDYNWSNFAQVKTQQGGTFNLLAYWNGLLGTQMTSEQFGTMIIIHELEHNRPMQVTHSAKEYGLIVKDCIN
jgi:RHS repeat-associated protein